VEVVEAKQAESNEAMNIEAMSNDQRRFTKIVLAQTHI
jgi:hypothetical protein